MRGNQVYIKDDTVTEQQGPIPAGFKAVEVETGLISDSYVENQKAGFLEGDTVYVAESSQSSDAVMMMPGGGMGGGPGGGPGGGMGGGPGGR